MRKQPAVSTMMSSSGGVALVVALLVMAAAAATGAGAAKLCNVEQSALATCGSYCRAGSAESSPSQACCDGLRGADLRCFCSYRSLLSSYGLDPARTMQIPSKCGFGAPNPCG